MALVMLQGQDAMIGQPWYCHIALHGLNRRSDADNRIKAVLDLLTKTGIVADDRWCDKVTAERVSTKGTAKTVITIGSL